MSKQEKPPELKPCPFCGKESSGQEFGPGPYIARSQNSQFKSIICSGCCSIASGETESRVIERWNTRAPAGERVAELEAALFNLRMGGDNGVWGCWCIDSPTATSQPGYKHSKRCKATSKLLDPKGTKG